MDTCDVHQDKNMTCNKPSYILFVYYFLSVTIGTYNDNITEIIGRQSYSYANIYDIHKPPTLVNTRAHIGSHAVAIMQSNATPAEAPVTPRNDVDSCSSG